MQIKIYTTFNICEQTKLNTKVDLYKLLANSFTKDIMLIKLTGATVAQWSRWLVKLPPVITVAIVHCSVGSSLSLVKLNTKVDLYKLLQKP
jgi:hypothetical protein